MTLPRHIQVRTAIALVAALLLLAAPAWAQTTWYVDDNAPNDPGPGDPNVSDPSEDGSAANPFDAIQEGIDAASNPDEVVVLAGTYTGPGNRDLDYGGKAITVRSTDPNDPNVVAATIINCQSSGRGFYFDNGEDPNSVVAGLFITGGYAQEGGAIYCAGSSPTIANCYITWNVASWGGGVRCDSSSSPTISNCTLSWNMAGMSGGAINCWSGSNATIINCVIERNRAWDNGGGISCYFSDPSIVNCTITDNGAVNWGGGLVCYDSNPTITNCTISENTYLGVNTALWGCGVYCASNSNLAIYGSTISGNLSGSAGPVGVGIACLDSNLAIYGSTISGNLGSDGTLGVGIACMDSNMVIVNSRIIANSTQGGWGGGALCANSDVTIRNSIVVGNVSINGGGLASLSSNVSVISSTLAGNTAYSGGGVYCGGDSGDVTLSNSVVWGNSASGDHQILLVDSGQLSLSYCDLQGGRDAVFPYPNAVLDWGEGNIDADPLITPDGHLRFDPNSPCINAGDPNYVLDPNSSPDIDGDLRILGGRVDIGADEFLDSDADRLPDWWETAYFDANTVADPNADPDNDGLSNIEEYEQYSSHPNAPPIYVDDDAPNDPGQGDPNVSDPNEDGSMAHPFDTIQEGIDAASDGDTVLVAQGTYSGPGNMDLDYGRKAIIVRASDGPATTLIDCSSTGRAINYAMLGGAFAVLEGFAVTGGSADLGGGIRTELARLMVRDCVVAGNDATATGGGLHTYLSSLTFDGLVIGSNTTLDPNYTDAGVISSSNVYLQGDLTLQMGRMDLLSSWFDGPNTLHLEPNTLLRITGDPGSDPTVIRSDIAGLGDIQIDLGQELIIDANAVIDLSGGAGCNPDPDDPNGGLITVEGALVVQGNATIRNTKVDVKLAEFDGNNDIINNNIALLEASTGFGGQFFVSGNATISCNTIVSDGDRYLDLDPDPDSPSRPMITNNRITVIIKQGVLGSEGTLLELRAHDYDCCGGPNNTYCESGAFQVTSSEGFTTDPSENWVLEELRIDPSAKLNLTNRQGFVFQDPNDPNAETVYVKKLKLCDNAVLNTGLQTLYYQALVDQNDVEIIRDPNQPNGPFANGSRIIDIPMMGFSLAIIAMEDNTEFEVRVRRRLLDDPLADSDDPNTPMGSITREEGLVAGDPNEGVMHMRTKAIDQLFSAQSVTASGAFARAGEDDIAVAFEYLFRQDPSGDAYLTVYLTDRHATDANDVAVARVYPPAFDRRGAVSSNEFAVFNASVPRGDFNFTRGTYVKIELHGTDAVCWIDNWDPYIECTDECASMDGLEGVTEADYLLLLVAASGQDLASMWCADVTGDGYLDITDLLSWDAFFSDALNLCPTVPPAPIGGAARDKTVPSFSIANSMGVGDVLVIAGKSGDPDDYQYDFLYTMEPNDDYAGQKQSPTCPGHQCDTGNGRLLTDNTGTLYQVHGLLGLIHRESGTVIIPPDHTLTYNDDPNFGDSDAWVGIANQDGLPLTDAVFDRTDPRYVYVVPVMVHRPGGQGDPYKAVAKLEILGDPNDGNYDVVGLYGKDPNGEPNRSIDPITGDVTLETDVWQVREIDIDCYGNLFVLSAQAWNDNDWVLIYDETLGNGSEVRVLVSGVVEAPTALRVSSDNTTVYLASAKNDPNSDTTQIYRFTINRSGPTATGLTYVDSVEITNMRHITAFTENPATGMLYVMGLMAPTFDPEGGNPGDSDPIFTWPTMAMIPDDANGPVAATDISCLDPNVCGDPNQDLALPLSAVYLNAGAGYTLDLTFKNGSMGTVTVEPNLPIYPPCTHVTLTAEPNEGKKFKKWKVWDAYDANIMVIDTNNPITIDMVADRQVKAVFKCGGGGVEEGLPLLAAVGLLALLRRRR